MSADSASLTGKVDSDDSIVACLQDAADFFDSIGPGLAVATIHPARKLSRISCRR
jgi:hypothetical protein